MSYKIIFFFNGTLYSAQNIHDSMERERFNDNVVRVYLSGCHDKHIGGRNVLAGSLSPNFESLGENIRAAFKTNQSVTTIDLNLLARTFGSSIMIEPVNMNSVPISNINLWGFSRGAIEVFSVAQELDCLAIPIAILAQEPVPGITRAQAQEPNSLYAKNYNLSKCDNLTHADLILGNYSNSRSGVENKWFRQMSCIFSSKTNAHIYTIPKNHHFEATGSGIDYRSNFLFERALTKQRYIRKVQDRLYMTPKVARQKHHIGTAQRTEFLPSFKERVYNQLLSHYPPETCPLNEYSTFKKVQSLLVLHNYLDPESETFKLIRAVILLNTLESKNLREFIVELDSMIQYCNAQSTMNSEQTARFKQFSRTLFFLVAHFQKNTDPSLMDYSRLKHSIEQEIAVLQGGVPSSIANQCKQLMALFLIENTLMHPHLGEFITEDEGLYPDRRIAQRAPIDGLVTNLKELAQKLFHSSTKQRKAIYDEVKTVLSDWVTYAQDLLPILPFIAPDQLKDMLTMRVSLDDLNTSIQDILLLMSRLPTSKHRGILYKSVQPLINHTNANSDELIKLMEFLSYRKCMQLCEQLSDDVLSSMYSRQYKHLREARLDARKIALIASKINPLRIYLPREDSFTSLFFIPKNGSANTADTEESTAPFLLCPLGRADTSSSSLSLESNNTSLVLSPLSRVGTGSSSDPVRVIVKGSEIAFFNPESIPQENRFDENSDPRTILFDQ